MTSETVIKHIALGIRGCRWEKALILSKATDHEVSPQAIIGYRAWLKEHHGHAA